jgi:hypothetical protein
MIDIVIMITHTRSIIKHVFVLQFAWFVMFFTNILGFIGSRSELLQDIVWLGIPSVGVIVSVSCLRKRHSIYWSISTIYLAFIIFGLWVLIWGITQM